MSQILGLDSILNFGQHKGQQLEDLIEDQPDYVRWLIENEIRDFDDEVLEVVARKGIA